MGRSYFMRITTAMWTAGLLFIRMGLLPLPLKNPAAWARTVVTGEAIFSAAQAGQQVTEASMQKAARGGGGADGGRWTNDGRWTCKLPPFDRIRHLDATWRGSEMG